MQKVFNFFKFFRKSIDYNVETFVFDQDHKRRDKIHQRLEFYKLEDFLRIIKVVLVLTFTFGLTLGFIHFLGDNLFNKVKL